MPDIQYRPFDLAAALAGDEVIWFNTSANRPMSFGVKEWFHTKDGRIIIVDGEGDVTIFRQDGSYSSASVDWKLVLAPKQDSITDIIERLETLMCRCENNGDYCEACALLAGLKEVRL